LDGTLFRSDTTLSERTLLMLRRCREEDIKVVYATGRGGNINMFAPDELFDGRVVMNGAIAAAGETTVYSRLIPFDLARPLLLACDKRGMQAASQVSRMHYANFIVSDVWPHITYFKLVDFAVHNIDAEKLYMVMRNPEDAVFIEKHLPGELYMYISVDKLVMVMQKEATKAKAVAALANHWGIDKKDIAAFGDDTNDIDLLNYAGVGIAMGNALPEVKSAADMVCKNNDEDGLAEWVEEFIL
jgi:hypothetical protein